MNKKLTLSIENPCHEDWNKMSDDAKGKFCGSCQKQVIDFTSMSESQLVAFFKKPAGSVCGRFRVDQLENEMTIPSKRIPWIKYFFQFALPAFLFSQKAKAQGEVTMRSDTISIPIDPAHRKLGKPVAIKTRAVTGRVLDEEANGIPFATVTEAGTKNFISCDEKGNFRIVLQNETSVLNMSSVGYEVRSVKVNSDTVIIRTERSFKEMLGMVISYPRKTADTVKKNVDSVNTAVTPAVAKKKNLVAKVIDTVFTNIRVFPNPAASGAALSVDISSLKAGHYLVTVTDMNGKLVKAIEKSAAKGEAVMQINLTGVAAGSYLLSFQNQKELRNIYSQKILVQ